MGTYKKIFLVAYNYPPTNGGIARLCHEIKKGLSRRKVPIEVITPDNYGEGERPDICVTRIKGERPILDIKIFNYLRANVAKNDLVIADTWYPAGLIAELASKNVYILAHGLELIPGQSRLRRLFLRIMGNWVLSKSNGIIANSHFTSSLVKNISSNSHVKAIPLSVDTGLFKPTISKTDDDVLHIFSISRLEKFKGHDFLINVVAKFNDIYPNKIKLSIGGKGPFKEELERQVQRLDIEGVVSFEGFVSDEELCDYYSKNDLFILCTRQSEESHNVEGFGLVFCEAQACGTPVIGTRTGGIGDAIMENNGGWLINQDDEKQLLDMLIKLSCDKKILKVQGAKARKRMEEYDWSKYIDCLLNYVGY